MLGGRIPLLGEISYTYMPFTSYLIMAYLNFGEQHTGTVVEGSTLVQSLCSPRVVVGIPLGSPVSPQQSKNMLK